MKKKKFPPEIDTLKFFSKLRTMDLRLGLNKWLLLGLEREEYFINELKKYSK